MTPLTKSDIVEPLHHIQVAESKSAIGLGLTNYHLNIENKARIALAQKIADELHRHMVCCENLQDLFLRLDGLETVLRSASDESDKVKE